MALVKKIKAAGYDVEYNGTMVKNPKTGKSVFPKDYNKDEKGKVDFKGKLDSTRPHMTQTARYSQDTEENKIPKSAKVGVDKAGHSIYNQEEVDSYSPRYIGEKKKSTSTNINDYNKAVKDRDENRSYAERSKKEDIPYYENKVKQAQKDLDTQKNYVNNLEKRASNSEARRQEILNRARANRNKN